MKTKRIKIYSFDELSAEAQQKAINGHSSINVDFDWWESIYEDAKNIGLKITGFDLDRNRHASGEFILSACEVSQNIFNNHGENCSTFLTAQNFINAWQPLFNNYMDENSEDYESNELENEMQEAEDRFLNSLLEDYSIILQNECEYLQSDEVIKETLIANEYEFLKSGKIFNL